MDSILNIKVCITIKFDEKMIFQAILFNHNSFSRWPKPKPMAAIEEEVRITYSSMQLNWEIFGVIILEFLKDEH